MLKWRKLIPLIYLPRVLFCKHSRNHECVIKPTSKAYVLEVDHTDLEIDIKTWFQNQQEVFEAISNCYLTLIQQNYIYLRNNVKAHSVQFSRSRVKKYTLQLFSQLTKTHKKYSNKLNKQLLNYKDLLD